MSLSQKQVHWEGVKKYNTKPAGSTASVPPISSPSLSYTRANYGTFSLLSSSSSSDWHQNKAGTYVPYIGTVPLPPETLSQPGIDEHIQHNSPWCLQLDLSLPSEHFRDRIAKYINLPACNPPSNALTIVMDHKDIAISPKGMTYLTIGRVLGDLHNLLRQPVKVDVFRKHEEITANVIRQGEQRSNYEVNALQRVETTAGVRNVDFLLGRTIFDGFSVLADGRWQLHLKSPVQLTSDGHPDKPGPLNILENSGEGKISLDTSKSLEKNFPSSPLQTHLITAATALEHAHENAQAILAIMHQNGISVDQYIVRAGFNENLIARGVGLLEQIYVLLCVDVAPTSTLLTTLGQVLSPYPCILITPAGCQQLPTFKANGDIWDFDSIIMSRTVHFPSGVMSRDVSSTSLSDMTYKCSTDTSSTPRRPGDSDNWDKDDDDRDEESGDSGNGDGPDRPDHSHDSGEDGGSGGGSPGPSKGKQASSRIPRAHFQVTVEIYCRNSAHTPFQDLKVSGTIASTIGEAYPPDDEMSESKAKFLKLKFQTRSRGGVSTGNAYQQYFCRVTVDTSREFAHALHATPSSTLDSEGSSKETTMREVGWMGMLSIAGKGILAVPSFEITGSTSRTAKDQSSLEVVKYSSRIIQEDSGGTASWRFFVDDKNMRENGLTLEDDKLPSVEFEFFGDEGSTPPSTIFVEAASYWSIPTPKSWLSFASCDAEPLFQNVCHIVAMQLPTNMTKSVNYVATLKKRPKAQDETCVRMNQGSLEVLPAALPFKKVIEEVPSLIPALKTKPVQKSLAAAPSELLAPDISVPMPSQAQDPTPISPTTVSSNMPVQDDAAVSVPRDAGMG